MELLITFAIFAIVVVGLWYLIRYLPDPTLQNVAKIIVVIGALIWLLTHIRAFIHAIAGS